jgi:hypothetical protein
VNALLVLTLASTAAGVFALCRFVLAGAFRSYPWFVAYLAAGALQSLGWFAGTPSDRAYVLFYAYAMTVIVALRVLVVVELWRKLMPGDRGVEMISRSALWMVIAVALGISAASGLDTLRFFGTPGSRIAFYGISLGLRYSGSALCVICSCLSLFAILFPRNVPANAVRHAFLLTAYFATIAVGFLAMHYIRGSAAVVGALMTGSSAGLYVLWGALVSQSGEQAPVLTPAVQAG